ncbi:MAG: hypothetical protein A2W99_03345 [Bacteroidetes bacterium GWF2_33_16]|nr:MAG: hypothetical protein A2X00_11725 [Bacteroidetes bacterium GWE2_32_14]OFY08222.1 MAG: hypothetical protein A2W99_03345 [Bacteroidetes bacterium GWF2_33_16]
MKILVAEKSKSNLEFSKEDKSLKQEASHVYQLYLQGILREIYFNEMHSAILVLECKNKTEAFENLSSLPLVGKN